MRESENIIQMHARWLWRYSTYVYVWCDVWIVQSGFFIIPEIDWINCVFIHFSAVAPIRHIFHCKFARGHSDLHMEIAQITAMIIIIIIIASILQMGQTEKWRSRQKWQAEQSKMIELCANIRQIAKIHVGTTKTIRKALALVLAIRRTGIEHCLAQMNEMGGSMALNYVRINCKWQNLWQLAFCPYIAMIAS